MGQSLAKGVAPRQMDSAPSGLHTTPALQGRDIRRMGVAHPTEAYITNPALKGRNISAMGQSLVQNYLHIVFGTKYRQPLIHPPVEQELHSYLGGICNKLECPVIKVGGYTDHIHILCKLSKKIALMKLVEEVKSHSSKWIKTKGEGYENFYWQDGYGAFSVNPSQVDTVIAYIANQHEHHSKKTFQEEYRAFLKKYQVEYDERYVWD
ncbi:MAG: IS200/IS605 family transposase [Saprospiraceae bacterium]|nr:IS200/IS605 family transposase [Saprospiraceae bacterium]